METHDVKRIFIGFVLFVAISCIIVQFLDLCGCYERCRCKCNKKQTNQITVNQQHNP